MGSKVDCPFCKMRLNLGQEMFGQPISCPGCKNQFTPNLPPQATAASSNDTGDLQPHDQRTDEVPNNLSPQHAPPPANLLPHPPRGGNPIPLFLGCLGGGCLLIVIIVILITMLWPAARNGARKNKNEARLVQPSDQWSNELRLFM